MSVSNNPSPPADLPHPHFQRSKTSTAYNAAMRQIIRPWAYLASTPPGCRAVSFSSWTRFSPSTRRKPNIDLKASVLCAATGTTPGYDPPLLECAHLGVDQFGKSEPARSEERGRLRSESNSASLRTTARSGSRVASVAACSSMASAEPITFRKIEVKASRSPTNSLLTERILRASAVRARDVHKPYITEVSQDGVFPYSFDSPRSICARYRWVMESAHQPLWVHSETSSDGFPSL